MTKQGCADFLKELMVEKGYTGWDDTKFNRIYNLFEDDGACGDEKAVVSDKPDGLDRGEFEKLVKRMRSDVTIQVVNPGKLLATGHIHKGTFIIVINI